MSSPQQAEYLSQRPFRFYMKQFPRPFAIGVVMLFFTNLFDSLTPLALKYAIDAIQAKEEHPLLKAVLLYIGLNVAFVYFRYGWRIYWGKFHQSVADDLRARIFTKLTFLGPSFYQKNPIGQLISIVSNDVNSFRMGIGPGFLILLDGIFYLCMYLPAMIWVSWDWTWKTLILLPLIPPFMRKMEQLMHEYYRIEQDKLGDVSANAQEIVSGVRVIKAYTQESNQLASFDRKSKIYEETCNKVAKLDAIWQPVMEFSVASGTVMLLWFCTEPVMRGAITLGTLFAFHEYIRRMTWPMSALGFSVSMIEQGRASFDRIRELLEIETDIPDNGEKVVQEFEKLEVKDLSFRYTGAEHYALRDISLTINAGETIGIVGPVGSGKTTLMNVICRLYPVEHGKVTYNDISVEDLKQSSLRRLISYVPQDAFLFSDTVAENIALGYTTEQAAINERVKHFASVVNIDSEIEALPTGYESLLGERGVNLSGGQKQRLTIARALIRNSQFVILDDSLSAVDGKTEKLIVEQLKGALDRRTVLIVSHRLATLRHADRIFVLNNGTIEAVGKHDELLKTSVTYKELNTLQSELVSRSGPPADMGSVD